MSTPPAEFPSVSDLARMIDHSLLHPTLTDAQLDAGCELARHYEVATVCVKPSHVARAARTLQGSTVKVCAVIGFPHGHSLTATKVFETELALRDGAVEIDMVANAGDVIGGNDAAVTADIRAVNATCRARHALLKVIFENDFLDDAQIVRLCRIAVEVGVAFVKTSTGYGFVKQANGDYNYRGATDHHLQLMRAHTPATIELKAAGGVRTLDDLLRVRALGVTRIGATATATMIEEAMRRNFPRPWPAGFPLKGRGSVSTPGY